MASSTDSRLDGFKEFLVEFSQHHNGPMGTDDSLPFRIVPYYITEEEIEGECIDLCMQYLTLSKCPHVLLSLICKASLREFLSTALDQYLVEDESDGIKLYQASKIARGIFSCLHAVCNQWSKALPDFNLSGLSSQLSVHAIKNTRRKMEDRHVIVPDVANLFDIKDNPHLSYYAVFDGHGGLDASSYAAAHVLSNLVHQESFNSNLPQSLKQAYLKTDANFVYKCEREQLRSGSTGVSVILTESKLHIAWLGDSQAVLVRDGRPVELMDPHKPERQDEKKRIESLGGCVVFFGAWRVNGSLSVSRAIGDAEHKPYISGEPDVATFPLTGAEDYLVLACDGLWDTVTPAEMVKTVYEHIQTSERSTVAEKLVRTAKSGGSNDNISVIVVFLKDTITPPSVESSDETVKIENEDILPDGDHEANEKQEEKENATNVNNLKDSSATNNDCDITTNQNCIEVLPQDSIPMKDVSERPSEKNTLKSEDKRKADMLKSLVSKRKARRTKKTVAASKSTVSGQSKLPPDNVESVEIAVSPADNKGQTTGQSSVAQNEAAVSPPSRRQSGKQEAAKKKSTKSPQQQSPSSTPVLLGPTVKVHPPKQTFGSEANSNYVSRTKSFPVSLKPKRSSLKKKLSMPCSGNNNVDGISRGVKEMGSLS